MLLIPENCWPTQNLLKRPNHNIIAVAVRTVLIVNLIYFIRKQQGSSAYLIEIGGSSYTGMFGYLTALISRNDRAGTMSYLYGMVYVTCILLVKRKSRLINFLTWVLTRFISFICKLEMLLFMN